MKIIIKDDEDFGKAHKRFERFTEDERLRDLYNSRVEFKRRVESDLEEGMEKALKEGMEKGLEQGRENEKLEIARSMTKKGMDTSLIAELTGLSQEAIEKL